MSLIAANDISLSHGEQLVLDGVSLAVEPGEIVTLVGPNGSGKSSLVKTLIGLTRPERGSVTRKPGLRLGYVPQNLPLDANLPMTVARFLDLPVRRSRAEVEEALADTGSQGLEGKQLSALSGGQLQRVVLARALLNDPELLILDEPTQGLDQPGEAAFYRLLERIRDTKGCAVFMVSHDLHVVMSASDRVICLNHHVCCEGTPHVVRDAPEYRALFGPGTGGALALYQHEHDHSHDHGHDHAHGQDQGHEHGHPHV